MIYCLINPETNALLGIVEQMPESQAYVSLNRDMPDFAKEEWNPAIQAFFTKHGVGLSKLEYLRRFTVNERVAIRAAAAANPVLADYLAMLELAQEINLRDTDTIAAVNMLEQAGLIGTGRAAEILS